MLTWSRLKAIRLGELLLVISSSIAVEVGLSLALVNDYADGLEAAIGHVALTAMLGAWAWNVRKRRAVRMAVLLTVATGTLGPFGAVGALLCFLLNLRLEASALSFEEWYASLFPENERGGAEKSYELIISGRDLMAESALVESFGDVLAHGDVDRQLAAVAIMSRNYRPAFSPALLYALHHGTPAVRVQAASAVAHIENGFHQRLDALEMQVRSRPEDSEGWFALGCLHDDHSFTGLLDKDRQKQSRFKALEAYRKCLELSPDDERVAAAIGRLLLRLGDAAAAADWLESRVTAGQNQARWRLWYGECLFRLNRLEDLRALLAGAPASAEGEPSRPPVFSAVAALWSQQATPLNGLEEVCV